MCLEVPVVITSNISSLGPPDPYLINECALRPTICGGGKCIDTVHGYNCECFPGYAQGSSQFCEGRFPLQSLTERPLTLLKRGIFPSDIDECLDRGFCQGGSCENTPGSFQCNCPKGFDVSSDGKFCIGKRIIKI